MNRFYVYQFVIDGVVRYIGKGSGWRAKQHLTIARRLSRLRSAGRRVKASYFHNKLAKELARDASIGVEFIATGLAEADAYAREVAAIAAAPMGQLWNRKSGGFEGVVYGDDIRRKLSLAATKRYRDPAQRALAKQIASDIANNLEARAKRSQTQARRFAAGKMPEFHAKSHTSETYKKRGQTLKRTLADRPDLRNQVAEWRAAHMREHAAALKAAHQRPDVKAKRRAYYDSAEGRAKLKAASDARWAKHRASTGCAA